MAKTREELQRELDANNRKIEQYRHQVERLDNRIRDLTAKQRKERTHRLITRGAVVESIWPTVKEFSETDFYALMENVLSQPQALSILQSIHHNPRASDGAKNEII